MLPWIIGTIVVGTAAAILSSSDEESSSSRSSTSRRVIDEPKIDTRDDLIKDAIKDGENIMKKKYNAKVEFDKTGNYNIYDYGSDFNKLNNMLKESCSILDELNKIENDLRIWSL